MTKHFIYPLIIIFVLLLSASFFIIYESRVFVTRASITQSSFSVDNSYVFATPLRAQANGLEKIRVTVFVLNSQGLGVLGKSVSLGESDKLSIETVKDITDQQGKAVFDLSTRNPGQYYLEVKVDNVILPQKLQLNFN
ncbi:MAG TPA: Ig-like domain-containing protein [Candidatus Nitrosocosmicus sp.]|nr:Ig-like domain-containing protein [Candidatus Nitrosocosmicus sp.]